MKYKRPKNKTLGQVRYITYWLIFPGENDYWVDQTPFVHDLDFELKQTKFYTDAPDVYRDLLLKGEANWKDHNGVRHRVAIEDKKRERKWGKNA